MNVIIKNGMGGEILLNDREDSFSIYEVVKNKNIAVRVDYSYKIPEISELEKDSEIWIYNLRIGKYGVYPVSSCLRINID